MKYIKFIIVLSIPLFTVGAVFSATPTPSKAVTASPSAVISKPAIEKSTLELKEKVANIVKQQSKGTKAVAGFIQKTASGSITIKANDDRTIEVKPDDTLTKVYGITGSSKKEIAFDTLKKGEYVIVTGPVIDATITANTIYRDEQFVVGSGKITEVLKDDYAVSVMSSEKESITLDYETSSRMTLMNVKTFELEKSSFSKLKEGDTVHYVLRPSTKEKRFSIVRLVVLPQEYFLK